MAKTSAGLLMYKITNEQELNCFLVHPGGPYYQNKHLGTWGIPKGLVEEGEEVFEAGLREFKEETGILPSPPYYALDSIRYSKGKVVYAWGFEGNWEESLGIVSNSFQAEWPPKSGIIKEFPEVDEGRWMNLDEIRQRIHPAQWPLVFKLYDHLVSTGVITKRDIPQEL